MKTSLNALALASMVATLIPTGALADRLPMLDEDPWNGWYSGWEAREFRFGVSMHGKGTFFLINSKDEEHDRRLRVTVEPLLKTMRKGRWKAQKIKPDGWTAVTPASADPERIVYQGTVESGIRFEVSFEKSGTTLLARAKVLQEDPPSEEPVLFGLMVRIPNGYYKDKNQERREGKAEDDRIDLVTIDGERLRLNGMDDGTTATQGETVFRSARVEFSPFKGHRFEFDAGDTGHLELRSEKDRPLYKRTYIFWKPREDAASTEAPALEIKLR